MIFLQKEEKAPFFNTKDTLFQYSADMLIIGTALLSAGIYLNGVNALFHALISCMSAVLCEYICFTLFLKKQTLGDLSALSMGLLIALTLPASAPLWLSAVASAFAVIAVKLPFGGARYAPFVPACAGICFISLCFPQYMFTYAAESSAGLFVTDKAFVSGTTLLDLLSAGKSVSLNTFGRIALFSGTYPGAIGTTSVLMMIASALYLFVRRPKRLYSFIGFICAVTVVALLFPRVNSGLLSSVVLELSAGSLLFTALMFIPDPVTSPKDANAALIYGAAAGFIAMLLRFFAKVEDPVFFSVLIINALWPVFVREKSKNEKSGKRKPLIKTVKKPKAEGQVALVE